MREGRGATARPREASGARESQLFIGYITTRMFSKIHLDITTTTTTTTTTEQHYIIRMRVSSLLGAKNLVVNREGPLSRSPYE